MSNEYLNFISDEDLILAVKNLHESYLKAKGKITKTKFYKNKIDTIKLMFDAKFNDLDEELLIKTEINRQIDKSINNSIGTFHEEILGSINGFQKGNLSGYDIKADDDSLFADIKNKHNTMNSSSAQSLFEKLANYADTYKQAKCYWVQILAKSSFTEKWQGDINGKEYSHSRVYKISGDQFYALLTKDDEALYRLYQVLPKVIDDFLEKQATSKQENNSVFKDIVTLASQSNSSILDQITSDNYNYYLGFDKLK